MIFGGAKRDGRRRWRTLKHEGVAFPTLPVSDKHITIKVKGGRQQVTLPPGPAQTMLVDYVAKGGTPDTFMGEQKYADNFWCDWTSMYLPARAKSLLKAFKGCDISEARGVSIGALAHSSGLRQRHETVVMDGTSVSISPWMVDRPGIFIGRTKYAHLTGRIRPVLGPADVTINIGRDERAPVPPHRLRQRWAEIVHDPYVDWVASWRDPVTKTIKYSRFAAKSKNEQVASKQRFDLARKVYNGMFHTLNREILAALAKARPGSQDQQVHACLWLIIELGLRIGSGGHAGRSAKGGSYGAATLLGKHVSVASDGTLRLDFPGKDGVRYTRTVPGADMPAVVSRAFRGLVKAAAAAGSGSPVFPDIMRTSDINGLLKEHPGIPGISAKVIRTARASAMFEAYLRSSVPAVKSVADARVALRVANARVALFCNHRHADGNSVAQRDSGEMEQWFRKRLEGKGAINNTLSTELKGVVDRAGLVLATSRRSYIDPRIEYAFLASLPTGVRPPISAYAKPSSGWAESTPATYRFAQKKESFVVN